MTPERAQEIVTAINERAFFAMGLAEKVSSLEGVTLAEMLEAKALLERSNETAAAAGGPYTLRVVPDDRLIAAAYTLEHFQPNGEAIVVRPTRQWPYNRRALGVVGLEPEPTS